MTSRKDNFVSKLLAMPNDPHLAAVLEHRTSRAFWQMPRADVLPERHEQPIDLDPVLLRKLLLERAHARFRRRGCDVTPSIRHPMHMNVDADPLHAARHAHR